jgi:1-acyl-sn-glycerol-3-phosphate acyltransferase
MIPTLKGAPWADYASDQMRVGPFSRAFPSLAFYARVGWIVLQSSARARRRQFGYDEWYAASLIVRSAFEKGGALVRVEGTAHIAGLAGPAVIIGNHMSTAETFLLASMLLPFRPATFVVKQSLVEYPVFKHIMRSRDPIVVGRTNPREDLKAVMEGGQERLRNGISVVIFPQRTRKETFEQEGFNTIGVKLAKRAGVPVVPLALKTNAWSNGRLLKDFGPFKPAEEVRFAFGPPIEVGTRDREAHETVFSFIAERLEGWGVPVVRGAGH